MLLTLELFSIHLNIFIIVRFLPSVCRFYYICMYIKIDKGLRILIITKFRKILER